MPRESTRSEVRAFRFENAYIRHSIDLSDDHVYAEYLDKDRVWKQFMIYTRDGYVRTDMDKHYIGRIHHNSDLGRLVFKATVIEHEIVGDIVERAECYLNTEVDISKWWLGNNEDKWKADAFIRPPIV